MLSLACVVVNDGSYIIATMDGANTVDALKETIKKKKMYNFPAHELKLFLAKTDGGDWLHISNDVVEKLRKRESIDAVDRILKNQQMHPIARLKSTAFGFGSGGVVEAVHVLAVVPDNRWEELRQVKMARSTWIRNRKFTLDPASVLDPTAVAEGTVQSTQALSNDFHDFGGFPAAMLVRKEMQVVWTILHDNFIGASRRPHHCALLGSSGVGKSALLLLFCCYLAVKHNYNVLLARDVSGLKNSRSSDAVLWFRGSRVTGYPNCDRQDLSTLMEDFEAEHEDTKFLIVCDGDRHAQLGDTLRFFRSCHLLALLGGYKVKSKDYRKLLLLPAWRQHQLGALAEALAINDIDERYAYSGGSAREFLRDLDDLKERTLYTLSTLQAESELGFMSADSKLDATQRIYIDDVDDNDAYSWGEKLVVDSCVALKSLASKWRLDAIATMLELTGSLDNGNLYGNVFEVLVHKLAHERRLELDVRDSAGDLFTSSRVAVTGDFSVTLGNGDDDYIFLAEDQKWARCLAFLTDKATDIMYWYPGYLRCPGVDCVLIVDGVVHYVHVTVASSLEINWDEVRSIHEAVIANQTIQPKAFKCVVVTPRTTPWGTFEGMGSGIPGLTMCHAHVTHDLAA